MLMGMADHLNLKLFKGIILFSFKLEYTVMFPFTSKWKQLFI